jgi:UDP-N-acetylmuramate dehydrogenase
MPGVQGVVLEGTPLAQYCTYRIGGPAHFLVEPAVPADVAGALRFAAERGLPWLALGLGSNVLISDRGFAGVVIRLGRGLDEVAVSGGTWQVGAGLPTPLLAKRTAAQGFGGLHRMVGVPGTVGGGVAMNAGCHGQTFADVVRSVTVVTTGGDDRVLAREEIPFRYRDSGLRDAVIVGATVELEPGDAPALRADQQKLYRWRRAGTPFDEPCCGSVFRNPQQGATAGGLIDEAGLKGFRVGGAVVSTKHGNYIINSGNATADDVRRVIDHVRAAVHARFDVALELEVRLIGA